MRTDCHIGLVSTLPSLSSSSVTVNVNKFQTTHHAAPRLPISHHHHHHHHHHYYHHPQSPSNEEESSRVLIDHFDTTNEINEYSELLAYDEVQMASAAAAPVPAAPAFVGNPSGTSLEVASNASSSVHPVSLDLPPLVSEAFRRSHPPPLRLMGGCESQMMEARSSEDRGLLGGEETSQEAMGRPPPLPQKMGLVGLKSQRNRTSTETLNNAINGTQSVNGSSSPGNSNNRLNHDLNGSSLSSSPNSTPPLPTSATPPDWIELSTTLSKDLKRDLLSKGIKKKIVSATSELIIKQDDSVQPLLPKEDPTTSSISSTTPTTSTTTSPSHTLLSSQNKGRAPQPPTPSLQQHSNFHRVPSNSDVIVNQPIRSSSSISRGLQVENEDLIQFSNTCHNARHLAPQGLPTNQPLSTMNNNNIEKLDKKRISSADIFDTEDLENNLDYEDEDFYEDLDGTESLSSVRTTEERMEYLESLEKCPCYAKCCIDSVITLFCVTLLG